REKILGFLLFELRKDSVHILNFAVHTGCRRAGVGTQLMARLIARMRSECSHITLEVRETNLGAQLFFRNLDFKAVAVLRDFYDDSGEAAYFMRYDLARDPEETSKGA